jgi:hypothetical protein
MRFGLSNGPQWVKPCHSGNNNKLLRYVWMDEADQRSDADGEPYRPADSANEMIERSRKALKRSSDTRQETRRALGAQDSLDDAKHFRARAKQCRDLAQAARDKASQQTLSQMADELDDEANIIDSEERRRET